MAGATYAYFATREEYTDHPRRLTAMDVRRLDALSCPPTTSMGFLMLHRVLDVVFVRHLGRIAKAIDPCSHWRPEK